MPQPPAPSPQPPRSAMTLIELLVVIIIMTTIVAAAIPLMSPSNDDRRLREAARGLNTYITGAQSRAIAVNRPVGVALKRLGFDTKRSEDNGVCLEAYYVEQQPAYCGFEANSRACVALHPKLRQLGLVLVRFVTRGTTYARTQDALPDGWDKDLFPTATIRPGDLIEISGTRYELLNYNDQYARVAIDTLGYFADPNKSANSDATGPRPVQVIARPLAVTMQTISGQSSVVYDNQQQINPRYDNNGAELQAKSPAPFWTSPAPYKVLRQPTPMADEPYQLPEGTAIDLRASGVGSGDYFYVHELNDNTDGVLIMFAPEGRLARVSYSQLPGASDPFDKPVVDNVFLLVGRRENAPPPDAKKSDPTLQSSITATMTDDDRAKLRGPLNWLQGSSRWVVIGSQSGRVATIENAAVDLADIFNKYTAAPYKLTAGSEELRNQQILAAREFTREMSQVGGR